MSQAPNTEGSPLRITIISASAGTGKTYRLTYILNEAIANGARPECVLATTFTNKAAAELKERTRRKLLQERRFSEAQRLGAARIGTVNAVCGQLVTEFAFELGLSPELRVLDEAIADDAFREALSSVTEGEATAIFQDLQSRLVAFDGPAAVRDVAEKSRANGLAAKDLAKYADQSVEEFLALFGKASEPAEVIDARLLVTLREFLVQVEAAGDTTVGTRKAVTRVEKAVREMERERALPWADWVGLAKLAPNKASEPFAVPVRAVAEGSHRHPRLLADIETAIRTVFSVASQAMDLYQRYKADRGLIDFADQEMYALDLLRRADVQERLRDELDLVLVDEFQDTNPVQLAIFLQLAKLAKQSYWVGDQKQAIYGFRGADPTLMDAAIRAVLGSAEPETLPKSYRSRPELVRLASDVFSRAFPSQGIPAARCVLEPAALTEAPDLGAVVERWNLVSQNVPTDAKCVAAGVQQFLADPTSRVRDGDLGSRPAQPGDIAVLCRKHTECTAVAAELEALGIRAAIPRAGLLQTAEGVAACAALRLFVDDRDALAKTELSRMIEGNGDLHAWLQRVVAKPYAEGLNDLPLIAALKAAREASPAVGALEGYDRAMQAADIAELCRRWGDADARLANLDRLRAHVLTYVSRADASGGAATPAGLVAWLKKLSDNKADSQAARRGPDAVVVTTWHAAKGLEWPIVVLSSLNADFEATTLGVNTASDTPNEDFDFADPLKGRWVRYWAQPYAASNTDTEFHKNLKAHPLTVAAADRAARQDLRLLYVGWTRARDRIVFAARTESLMSGCLKLLQEGGNALVCEPAEGVTWAGRRLDAVIRSKGPSAPTARPVVPGVGFEAVGPRDYPKAFVKPSDLDATGVALDHEQLGAHLRLTADVPDADRGDAVHGFLAADRHGLDPEARSRLAKGLLGRWGVDVALTPADLIEASDRLMAWVDRRWPGAKWCREWAVAHPRADGSQVRGFADLVLDTADGLVVIDHKSRPGSLDKLLGEAAGHAGQLGAYGAAIEAATGRKVIGGFIYFAVAGWVVQVGRGSLPDESA